MKCPHLKAGTWEARLILGLFGSSGPGKPFLQFAELPGQRWWAGSAWLRAGSAPYGSKGYP